MRCDVQQVENNWNWKPKLWNKKARVERPKTRKEEAKRERDRYLWVKIEEREERDVEERERERGERYEGSNLFVSFFSILREEGDVEERRERGKWESKIRKINGPIMESPMTKTERLEPPLPLLNSVNFNFLSIGNWELKDGSCQFSQSHGTPWH